MFLIMKKTKNPVSKVEINCRSYANYNKQNFQDNIKENKNRLISGTLRKVNPMMYGKSLKPSKKKQQIRIAH